jgi:hypothetical protein
VVIGVPPLIDLAENKGFEEFFEKLPKALNTKNPLKLYQKNRGAVLSRRKTGACFSRISYNMSRFST